MSELGRLTSAEAGGAAAGAGALLAIPLGATEQHGPHLPLRTDTDIAVAVAARLAAARPEVVVAPPLAYGSSGEHQSFPGTLSIGGRALAHVLTELIRSATETFDRVLLVNAHGGNVATLARVVEEQQTESRDVRVVHADLRLDLHAGRAETSAMLALAPSLVRSDLAAAGATAPLRELLPRMRAEGVRGVSPNGVLGDPTGASAEEGEALLARAAAEVIAFVEAW